MLSRNKPKERSSSRKVTPPSPSYMSNEQFAAYLADLRNNRMSRPNGGRQQPSPGYQQPSAGRASTGSRPSLGAVSISDAASTHQRTQSDAPSVSARPSNRPSLSGSVSSRYSMMSHATGRDYYPEAGRPVKPLKPSEVVPSATYIERGQRWMEKEEAFSLRQAMEDMDMDDTDSAAATAEADEKRIHEAALQEAAELVWQHQNPGQVPQPGAAYRYRPHLRKNSYAHARTASTGHYGGAIAPTGLARDPMSRSVSGSSTGSDGLPTTHTRSSLGSLSGDQSRKSSGEGRPAKPYTGLTNAPPVSQGRRRSSMKRNISGEVEKPFSGDQIWEEPEGTNTPGRAPPSAALPRSHTSDEVQPLKLKPKNPMNRVQFATDVPGSDMSQPAPQKPLSRYEIHKNPPSQSRNPLYTSNPAQEGLSTHVDVPRKHGVELRSDDIRQATSMRLSDRSPKLPTPSAVSDSPGRPIVSFDANWQPPEQAAATDEKSGKWARPSPTVVVAAAPPAPGSASPVTRNNSPFLARRRQQVPEQGKVVLPVRPPPDHKAASPQKPQPYSPAQPQPQRRTQPPQIPSIQVDGADRGQPVPSISVSEATPSIPTIILPDDNPAPPIPTICLPDNTPAANNTPGVPIIVTPDDNSSSKPTSASRPLPTPRSGPVRQPRGHWSPAPPRAGARATARCHACTHPIEGRFIALAGITERFHPACFACYTCGTALEALEISPEPAPARTARLTRISRRAAGEILPEEPGETMAEDGDDKLRFYCHLDWHELFAPRCRHCKTPILGEAVVALGGATFHQGHFFCAECGDPFEKGDTHIEVDGYAWCVRCQTKRTERRAPKCKRCKTAVVGQCIQALGGEWHDECFRCATCGGGFDDGQIFPRDGAGEDGCVEVLCTMCRERELKL